MPRQRKPAERDPGRLTEGRRIVSSLENAESRPLKFRLLEGLLRLANGEVVIVDRGAPDDTPASATAHTKVGGCTAKKWHLPIKF